MITLSTQDLMQLVANNPKEAKALVKALATPPSAQESLASSLKTAPNTIETLLQSLASKEIAPAQIKHTLEQASWFKHAPSLPNQLQTLATLTHDIPQLKPFSQALESFLKEIPHSPPKEQLARSGVFLENTLRIQAAPLEKEAPLTQALHALRQTLLALPLPHSTKAALQAQFAPLENPTPKAQPSNLLHPLLKTSEAALSTTTAPKRPLFALASTAHGLEKALQTQPQEAAKTLLSYPEHTRPHTIKTPLQEPLRALVQTALKQLKHDPLPLPHPQTKNPATVHQQVAQTRTRAIGLLETLLQKPITHSFAPVFQTKTASLVPLQNSTTKEAPALKPLHVTPLATPVEHTQKTPQTLLHVSPKMPFVAPETVAVNTWISTPPLPATSSLLEGNTSTQYLLERAVASLKTLITLLDAPTLALPKTLEQAKQAFALVKNLTTQPNTPDASSLPDVKKTLLSLKHAAQETSQPAQVQHLVAKSLAHIEMHQLYSYATHSAHTYFPYLWEGLQGGNVMMQKKEEVLYCQIDLEFQRFQNVHILLSLAKERYVSLSIALENPTLKERISTHIQELRLMLIGAGLTPSSIAVLPYEKREVLEKHTLEDDFGINFTV
jgi:hypothetical protein